MSTEESTPLLFRVNTIRAGSFFPIPCDLGDSGDHRTRLELELNVTYVNKKRREPRLGTRADTLIVIFSYCRFPEVRIA